MCYQCEQNNNQNEESSLCISKRSFLKLSAASALSLGMIRTGIANTSENIPVETPRKILPKPENVLTPDLALERLMQDNERYVSGKPNHWISMILNQL